MTTSRSEIRKAIDAILTNNTEQLQKAFDNAISLKVNEKLEQKRVELAKSLFTGAR